MNTNFDYQAQPSNGWSVITAVPVKYEYKVFSLEAVLDHLNDNSYLSEAIKAVLADGYQWVRTDHTTAGTAWAVFERAVADDTLEPG